MNIEFIDNNAIQSRTDKYVTVRVDVPKIIKSWQSSLFSYEWMLPDGRLKSLAELPAKEQPKRAAIEEQIEAHEALERPVLGIGLLETVEIGAGRATFLTLAAHGVPVIEVHIPRSHQQEFASFVI